MLSESAGAVLYAIGVVGLGVFALVIALFARKRKDWAQVPPAKPEEIHPPRTIDDSGRSREQYRHGEPDSE